MPRFSRAARKTQIDFLRGIARVARLSVMNPSAAEIHERESAEAFEAGKIEDRLNGNWMNYLAMIDSHKRLQPFVEIESEMTDSEYWEALEMTWTDMEFADPGRVSFSLAR
jgi:hypothetical protein